jgi:DNA-binding NarL/FixJ family response regulator
MAPIRLVIFEDNSNFRESLLQLFRFTPGIEVSGAFPDCSDAARVVAELNPAVVLMDVDMPGMNGIEATAVVKEINPKIQVVMLTVSEEEDRIFQALQNGATGYLLKKSNPDDIVESVRAVNSGGSPMSPSVARKVLRFFTGKRLIPTPDKTPFNLHEENMFVVSAKNNAESIDLFVERKEEADEALTPREYEILEALVDGLSYKMIAHRLYISPDTVKNHIQAVYRKLHVHSKGEAIIFAIKSGLINTNS